MFFFFAIFSLVLLLSAVGVVAFRNPLYSALCLVVHLIGVACLFAQLGAHFLATVQVIVYAGAIMVLVIFVLMLLNIKVEPVKSFNLGYVVIGGITSAALLYFLVPMLLRSFAVFADPVAPIEGGAKQIGLLLYSQYVFPFEIASILIMTAVVGAVMLAKRRYRSNKTLPGGQA